MDVINWEFLVLLQNSVLVEEDVVAPWSVGVLFLDFLDFCVGQLEQSCLLGASHIHCHWILHEVGPMVDC